MQDFGRYELRGLLGTGGMGEVHRAFDRTLRREVALKVLSPEHSADATYRARFLREATNAARLSHPNVVKIHQVGEFTVVDDSTGQREGRLYLDMELIEGTDLARLLESGRRPPDEAVQIVEQVARALDDAHGKGLVHRDVKPANVLLGRPGDGGPHAYLCDFGIALALDTTGPRHTVAGAVIGTLAYMAPERFHGVADQRTDVYSLACLLFETLTGRLPTIVEREQPSALRRALPAGLGEVVARGMARNPADRFAGAGELARAARRALTEQTVSPDPADGATVDLRRSAPGRPGGRLRTMLTDRWGLVVAGTAGGSAWAVLQASPFAVPIAVGVAAVVLGAKVAGDAFFGPTGGAG